MMFLKYRWDYIIPLHYTLQWFPWSIRPLCKLTVSCPCSLHSWYTSPTGLLSESQTWLLPPCSLVLLPRTIRPPSLLGCLCPTIQIWTQIPRSPEELSDHSLVPRPQAVLHHILPCCFLLVFISIWNASFIYLLVLPVFRFGVWAPWDQESCLYCSLLSLQSPESHRT